MPRYFLRVRDGDDLVPDLNEAEVFKTFAVARREAIDSARRVLSEAVLDGSAASLDQQIEVWDKSGKTLLAIQVGHAVGTDTQS